MYNLGCYLVSVLEGDLPGFFLSEYATIFDLPEELYMMPTKVPVSVR